MYFRKTTLIIIVWCGTVYLGRGGTENYRQNFKTWNLWGGVWLMKMRSSEVYGLREIMKCFGFGISWWEMPLGRTCLRFRIQNCFWSLRSCAVLKKGWIKCLKVDAEWWTSPSEATKTIRPYRQSVFTCIFWIGKKMAANGSWFEVEKKDFLNYWNFIFVLQGRISYLGCVEGWDHFSWQHYSEASVHPTSHLHTTHTCATFYSLFSVYWNFGAEAPCLHEALSD